MNFCVNFTKARRNYMVAVFDDERERDGKIEQYERTLHIGMPKKRVFDALIDMQETVRKKDEAETNWEKNDANRRIIDELYELTTHILANNLEREKITKEWTEETLSIDEIRELFESYVKFVNGEATSPN